MQRKCFAYKVGHDDVGAGLVKVARGAVEGLGVGNRVWVLGKNNAFFDSRHDGILLSQHKSTTRMTRI